MFCFQSSCMKNAARWAAIFKKFFPPEGRDFFLGVHRKVKQTNTGITPVFFIPVFVLYFLMLLFQDCDSLCGVLLSCYDCSNAWVCYAFIALIKCAPNSSHFMQCLPKVNAALPKPCGEKHTESETWNSYARSNHNFEQTNYQRDSIIQSTQLVELCEKAAAGENFQLSHYRIRFTMYFSASKSLSFARILIYFAFPKLVFLLDFENFALRTMPSHTLCLLKKMFALFSKTPGGETTQWRWNSKQLHAP